MLVRDRLLRAQGLEIVERDMGIMTRMNLGDHRVRIWMEPTDCWYWADEDGRAHGGFATMGDAIEHAQMRMGADVRVVRHSERTQ